MTVTTDISLLIGRIEAFATLAAAGTVIDLIGLDQEVERVCRGAAADAASPSEAAALRESIAGIRTALDQLEASIQLHSERADAPTIGPAGNNSGAQ